MPSLLKTTWKILVGVKDALVLLFLILFFALLYAGLKAARTQEVLPTSGALYLALDRPIVEQPQSIDQYAVLSGTGGPGEYRLRDVVQALEAAAGDAAIKAVVLDFDGFGGGGQVALQRVGEALDKVRAAGKPVLARGAYYDDDGYLLAAHANEIWLDPMGMVGVTGPGGSNLYFKGLIDRLGVTAHVYRVGTFKSAVEPFTQTAQSPEARAANESLVGAMWSDWQAHVAKARPAAKLRDYLADPMTVLRANGGDTAKAAQAAALVDRLGDRVAFGAHVAQLLGETEQDRPGDYSAVDFSTYMSRHRAQSGGQVGVITVAGEIVDGETASGTAGGTSVANLIRDAMAEDSIKALVLRVDSPGGSAAAAEEIRLALNEARTRGLPVVTSMGNVAASGGYWVATASDLIYAEPATITGSIGVFGILPSFEDTLAKIGVTSDGVKATPLSGEPNVVGGVSPEFNQLAQASVEDVYGKFIGLVATARKMTPVRVDEIAQGRVWAGGAAHQLKLVDHFGGIEDAVAEAARRAQLTGSAAQPRYFDPEQDPISRFLRMFTTQEAKATQGAPRDILSYAARQQRDVAVRIMRDLRGLIEGPSIRADCLECRSFVPPAALTSSERIGWFGTLLAWARAV